MPGPYAALPDDAEFGMHGALELQPQPLLNLHRAAIRLPNSTKARLSSLNASMAASTHPSTWRLNSTCSRTCQSSTRATSRFQPCTTELARPPGRGFTVPIAATLPSAESRACTSAMRSATGTPAGPAEVSGRCARTRSRTSRSMAISSALSTFSTPGCRDRAAQPAARREIPDHRGRHRAGGLHHVAEHAVHHVLLKDAEIPVGQQVHFVRLQLQAAFAGDIPQRDAAEIGKTGLGADRSEFRHDDIVVRSEEHTSE